MNSLPGWKADGGPGIQLLNCPHADCAAAFTRQWRLQEHETVHTGARPCECIVEGCGRRFTRRAHLKRHKLQHSGVKKYRCDLANCAKSFSNPARLKRHVLFAHGQKEKPFQCDHPNCSSTFSKRKHFKLHQQEHGVMARFKCSKEGCSLAFDSPSARKAHEKKHAGYRCRNADCQVVEYTWGKLVKHMAKHPATFPCPLCKKTFKKADYLRRHKRVHASHKPVLLCPRDDCQAYFSTTFNLQHHIRKVHLKLFKYKCSFPNCPRVFAMRESLNRHLTRHDPSVRIVKKRQRPKKSWQKRLDGRHLPLVEGNLDRLFALRMRLSRRAKLETNLARLFNERKIPHFVDPEVNLHGLFSIKKPVCAGQA